MGWTKQAKKDAVGKWIKFDEEHPAWTVLFMGDPKIVEKISTMGERKGEAYNAYEFPVEVEGEGKILSVTQRSLLRQLIEEEETEPLVGRTLMIKCLDLKTKKEWKIREVKAPGIGQDWAAKKEAAPEEEAEPEPIKEASEQDDKAKEKFKKEVEKRTRKRKAAAKTETGGEDAKKKDSPAESQ
ncbi:TPA_asm: hypothetical protein vir530_00017 [dsDNA virus vir530]|nr:TPA_asm: hypothetical protein vir530_00017 [dsDNA virus vir530]